jgi:hypothetical protein
LRGAFPHFQGGEPITPEAILEIGKQYVDMALNWSKTPIEIEFTDWIGNPFKLTWEDGEAQLDVGGWVLDPKFEVVDGDKFDGMTTAAAKACGLLGAILESPLNLLRAGPRFSPGQVEQMRETLADLKAKFTRKVEPKAEEAPRGRTPSKEPLQSFRLPLWLARDLLKYLECVSVRPEKPSMIPIGAINAFREIVESAEEGKPEPSSPFARDNLSMRLRAFLKDDELLSEADRGLIAEAVEELALRPKPKQIRVSDAQKVLAKAALKGTLGVFGMAIRTKGKGFFDSDASEDDYKRIANAVADAVVGAEQ